MEDRSTGDHAALASRSFVLREMGLSRGTLRVCFSTNVSPVECKTGNFKRPVRLNITRSNLFLVGQKNIVPEPSTDQISEALEFSRFRFKLIEFLKLPFDIREPAFREVLERTCGGVYRNYLVRAERIERILKPEDTLEVNVRVPLVAMDHRHSASPH
jgi:hypothetical protein